MMITFTPMTTAGGNKGLYYYGARYYDPKVSIWLSVDPLAEKYPFVTPYNFVENNPLRLIDPDGRGPIPIDENDPKNKVAIDPGHGDKNSKNTQVDPGAVNGSNQEKDFALEISKSISTYLEENGVETTMTRTSDVDDAGEKLQWRIDKANSEKADIFISVHINSFTNDEVNGFQVQYNPNSEDGKKLAQAIQGQNTLFKDRGTEATNNLFVLNNFNGPAVLIEAGFISNAKDLEILQTQTQQIGVEIGKGIIK